MVRTRGQSAAATPHSIPFKTDQPPIATAITPKTPLSCSTSIIPSSLKSVFLYDWWLTKADDGEGLAVGGFASREGAGVRVFYSAAISKRHEASILEAIDGIVITVSGFINRSRTLENGFPPKVYNHFLLGFPFNWKDYMGSSSDKKSQFKCIKGSTSHPDHPGRSHEFEADLDNLAVTRLRDLFLSSCEKSSHDLFMTNQNSSRSPTKKFESGLETPKGRPQRVNSYQYVDEQGFRDERKYSDVKDPLHSSQETDSTVEIEPQNLGSRSVCTRSMTKLKNASNRSKERLISDSHKRKKDQESNPSCENSGKRTEPRVKSSSNYTSTTDFTFRFEKEVDAITDKPESRRSSLRLRNQKRR
ncbi:Protein EMBRYO DEFECTIVE 1674, partial [Cucurbita argyrosperma subsp. sororia]